MKTTETAEHTVRLIAFDLDDTLLQEDLSISEENRSAIIAAEQAGVTVLLASGRVREAMYHYAEELGMTEREGYIVSGSGTDVIRTDTGEQLLLHTLPVEEATAVCIETVAHGFPVSYYHDGRIISSGDNFWVWENGRLSGMETVIDPDITARLSEDKPQKLVIAGDPDKIPSLEKVLRQQFGDTFHIIISKPFFLEFLPKEADKGHALKFLAEHLGIEQASVVAVGDSMNDLGMITYAGTGVAVGNAVAEIKEAADIVLDETHADHTAAALMQKLQHRLPTRVPGTAST